MSGEAYLEDTRELYGYVRPYQLLDAVGRLAVDDAMRTLTAAMAEGARIRVKSPVLIAVGVRS